MATYISPKKPTVQERVFKTPMTFSPRLDGQTVRPSPSRVELWREQFGLTDDSMLNGDVSDSGSDSDTDMVNNIDGIGSPSVVEYRMLQRQLDERNSQREELLYKIKTISDKMKHYKTRLEKEEANKRQQIKILRKAQENHLQDKQLLISNLEDMVGEQEARIMQLEAQINGVSSLEGSPDNQPPVTTKTSSLVEQILNLQREKSDLTTELLQQKSESASAQNDVIEHLKTANEKLDKDKQQLQEELIKQWGAKRGSGTDTEKQLCKIEIENDQLLEDLQGSRSRAISLQAELQQCHESSRLDKVHLDRLKEENARLRSDVQSVETRYSTREDQILVIEGKLWDQIDALKTDVTKLSLENEELRKKLLAATDKPPQIITKVERVEVESQECRKELEKSQNALQECENEAQSLREEVSSWKNKYEDVDKRLETNNNKVSALELTAAENSQLLTKVTELTTRCQDSDRQQQTDKTQITDLERQVFRYQNELSSMKSQVAEEIGILNEAKEAEIASIRADHKAASSEQTDKLAKLRRGLADTQRALERLVEEYRKLREICLLLPDHGKLTTKQIAKQVHEAIAGVSQYNQELVRKYRKEMQLRKKYHNELVELKGNIRVFCRVRPAIKEDGQGPDSQPVVSYDPDDDGILNVLYKGRPQAFELDQVFQPSSSQEQVFDEVQALVTSCIDGYNICIFAYGQTGSGKTYTMEGPSHNPGINQRALRELFKETHERRKDWDFTISVSVLEIYNENVRDLLSSDTGKLEVKMNPEGGLHVPGLQSHVVQDINDINQIFKIGQVNRATAVTNMNEHSSRSHALLCVTIHGNNHTTGARTLGKLNLVDLAGSERVSKSGAEGARLKEAQNINKSLSTLGDVIHALRNKQTHVPYRNSKLTYLLQDSLGGDSKTLMIVQVAPVEKNVGETVASLNFAQRVRTIELGQATRRVDSSDNLNGEESGSVFKTPKASQIKMKTPRK